MITIPSLDGGTALVIIEPGNIRRMKAGKPLLIQGALICFTPNMKAFRKMLGVDIPTPKKGEAALVAVKLAPEEIDAALRACQNLPEVEE